MGEYGHGINKAKGNYDMRNYITKIKENYPRVAYWMSWHSWMGDNKMAIIDNEHLTEFMEDPLLLTLDKLTWRDIHLPPNVRISLPAYNDPKTFYAGEPISIKVESEDCNGSIQEVKLFSLLEDDTSFIDTKKSAPYEFTWQDAEAGNHKIFATAIDNEGNENVSYPVQITVRENETFINDFENDGVFMYPNPARNMLNIKVNFSGLTRVTIQDLSTRNLYNKTLMLTSGNTYAFNLEFLDNGIYLLNLSRGEKRMIKKIVIKK
jgi:hypothetical protein